MSIEQELTSRLKEAMRQKDSRVLDVLRMVKARAQEKKTAPGFAKEMDDAFWEDVIAKYVRQQKKALKEFEKMPKEASKNIEGLKFEIEYLSPFLPKLLEEDQVRELVKQAIAETGAVGRALSNMGVAGSDPSKRPSREEMQKAARGRSDAPQHAHRAEVGSRASRPAQEPSAAQLKFLNNLVSRTGETVDDRAATDRQICSQEIERLQNL